jgi:acetoin:2,6-dichlorophenolindophenol oxidoreductase subunit alpha
MELNLWQVYEQMYRSRLFEEVSAQLWREGLISGELHDGTGEEAINAGVLAHLREGDALALDHRASAALIMRGVDPRSILREMLGHPQGLCGGKGGHMHLFSKEHLAASSGVIGAGGPAGIGFGLAAQVLRPGTIAAVFFGEGAVNQGMLMESLNLAAAWKLPILFVCKNDGWQITVQSERLGGPDLMKRSEGLGVPAVDADGLDVGAVWETAGSAIEKIRSGGGPVFLHARCIHLEGHFLGYQLIRITREPVKEMSAIIGPLLHSFIQPTGAELKERLEGMRTIIDGINSTWRDPRRNSNFDPVQRTRMKLKNDPSRLAALEEKVEEELVEVLESVMAEEKQ